MSEIAFENDCKRIIEAFSIADSTDFQTFCKEWLNREFFYIFHGFHRSLDAIEFTDNFIPVVTKLFSSAVNFREQLGAFYLWYILYYKQPAMEFTKIRLKVSDWIALKEFYRKIDESCREYDQAKLIFWKLWTSDAFRFSISKLEHGLEVYLTTNEDDSGVDSTAPEADKDPKKEVMKLVDERNGIVSAIQLIEMGYNEMKEGLKDSKNDKLLPQSTCAQEILKGLREINNVWNFQPAASSSTGNSRKKTLKKKAWEGNVTEKPSPEKIPRIQMSTMWKKMVKINKNFLEISTPLRESRMPYQSFANRTLNHNNTDLDFQDDQSSDEEKSFDDDREEKPLPEIE